MKTSSRGWNLVKIVKNDIHAALTMMMIGNGKNCTPQPREPLMLYSLSIDEGHCTAELVVEEPQSFTFLDVRVESRPVRTMHLFSSIVICLSFQNYHLVALGGIPVVHLLDPVEQLDGGALEGVALPRVHRVQRRVFL